LIEKIFPVVTVGNADTYNSMTASSNEMGLFFKKPTTMLLFPSKRYTLELIQNEKSIHYLIFLINIRNR